MECWLQTYTGKVFTPLDPKPDQICIEDIAHALSNICRYTGHTRKFYSVAQHSMLVAKYCSDENMLYGLLHDATEAYLSDIASPLKAQLPDYKEIEYVVWCCIAEKFNLPVEMPQEVHDLDRAILWNEKESLLSTSPRDWNLKGAAIPNLRIDPWNSTYSEGGFLNVYSLLTIGTLYSGSNVKGICL